MPGNVAAQRTQPTYSACVYHRKPAKCCFSILTNILDEFAPLHQKSGLSYWLGIHIPAMQSMPGDHECQRSTKAIISASAVVEFFLV
jgi:hypothetical protein